MISIHYSQIFLLIYIIITCIYYFLTYARVEAKHEKSIDEKYGKPRLTKIGEMVFSLILILWIVIIVIFFFIYEFIDWFWKISLLDNDFVKIIAMIIMCVALFLNVYFTRTVGKSIKESFISDKKSQLITTGIYAYIRHPAYLAMILGIISTLIIIPNIIMLIYLLFAIFGIYVHSRNEEISLVKIYGEEYERYKKTAGRFIPKIRKN